MGDGLKISKDKRHRSSSSIAGVGLDPTRSERKLDIRVSIPEVEDQFAVAEVRCKDLQDKIDLVKVLKRKKKFKRRSSTKIHEQTSSENVPFISVRTQPKKKVSQQAARLHRMDTPLNPVRNYVNQATIEQHRMIGQMKGNERNYGPSTQDLEYASSQKHYMAKEKIQRNQAGDGRNREYIQKCKTENHYEVGVGQNDDSDHFEPEIYRDNSNKYTLPVSRISTHNSVKTSNRNRNIPTKYKAKSAAPKWKNQTIDEGKRGWDFSSVYRQPSSESIQRVETHTDMEEERPVVELFANKERVSSAARRTQQYSPMGEGPITKQREPQKPSESNILSNGGTKPTESRKVKYRSRRYELPTVASQMKQAGVRYHSAPTNHTYLPFVVSKSTAPSHNIGVNLQQVLNGLKMQQPLSGIPLTIAHHMGLGHISAYNNANKAPSARLSLNNREINAIKLGPRLVRLPSYKYMSYSRLLNLYREGDGMVPRFLRAISRPHYFYTSMYNLATNHEDPDGATSKGHGGSQEAKQSLAEYASIYREYEYIEKRIKEGNNDPELERRKEELSKELALREEHIRKVVQDYRTGPDGEQPLRASASTADDYRQSSFKLNVGGDY